MSRRTDSTGAGRWRGRGVAVTAVALVLGLGTPSCMAQGQTGDGSSVTSGAASGALPDASQRMSVRYAEGLLTVAANHASLNVLLREIAKQTGMRISGSVREDVVFGTYGPAEPSRVLNLLLDGTGSNVLLVAGSDERPRELVLTRRSGNASPPDPNAAARTEEDAADATADDDAATPTNLQQLRHGPPAQNRFGANAPGYRPPQPITNSAPTPQQQVGGPDQNPAAESGQPSSTEQPVVFPPVDATTPPATASSSTAEGNTGAGTKDVRTPQQIFEELQRMRQQQTQGQQPQTAPQ